MKKHSLITAAFLAAGVHAAFAQTQQVTGTVVDEKAQPYISATILIKGTTTGTQTDADGKFSLNAPQGATLIIRALGYNDQEAKVTSNLMVFKLNSSVKALNETVVTALGIRKEKKRIGYTATEVSGETLVGSGEQNVVEALAAKAPGAQVTGSGGTPGASSKILLRGNTSLSGDNQPLFVVDGIPFDNGTSQPTAGDNPFNQNLTGVNESNRAIDINPSDIESVTVLRGPAAAALYGARGGNGAIIITTKKGKYGTGKRLGVTVSTGVNFFEVNKLPKFQNKYIQGSGGLYSNRTPQSWGPRADTAGVPLYDNNKKFFQTGAEWTNNVAIDGGNERAVFRLGIGNTSNKGVIPNSRFDRFTVNFSGETKLAEWLKVGVVANFANSNATRVQNGSNVGGVALTLFRAPINYDVDYWRDSTGRQTQYFSVYDNPRFTVERNPYTDVTNRVYGSFYTNLNFTPSLSLNWRLGVDNYNTNSRQIYDIGSKANDAADQLGQVNLNQSYYTQVYSDLILRYSKQLSEDFDVNALVGYNIWDNKSGSTFERGRNLQIPNLYNLGNTSSLYASNLSSFLQTQGLYSEVALGYRSRLFLTLSGRSDWSTAFGRGGRSVFYPKAEGAWVFSESIRHRPSWLSYGKIRAAYADVGNGVDVYTYRDRPFAYYTQPFITDGNTDGNSFPYLGQAGYAVSNVKYPGGLVPAHTEGIEAGLELRLFKSRVNLEATVYRQLTSDNLIQKPVAGSTGFQAEYVNAGEVENKGIELGLNVDVIKKKDLTWNVGGIFSKNVSKILSLTPGVSEISIEEGFTQLQSYAIVGQPYGVFYGTAWKRNGQGQLLLDSNGQAQVSSKTKNLGNPNPDWLMNLSTTINYKGFYASALFDIRHGGYIWNGTYARLNNLGRTEESANREQNYLIQGVFDSTASRRDQWGKENTTDSVSANYYYRTFKGDAGNNAAENAIQNGGWVRLRTLNLGYRFNIANKGRLRQFNYIDVSVTGRNLWLLTDYKGVDPETSLTGAGSNIGGWDYFNNPGTRSYSINLRVGL